MDLDLDLDLMISESEDLDLEEEDSDLDLPATMELDYMSAQWCNFKFTPCKTLSLGPLKGVREQRL